METLDLHNVRHHQVDRLVENFILLKECPMRIITGKSERMQKITIDVIIRHGFRYELEWTQGSIIVRD